MIVVDQTHKKYYTVGLPTCIVFKTLPDGGTRLLELRFDKTTYCDCEERYDGKYDYSFVNSVLR